MEAVKNFPSQAGNFVLSLGEQAISIIPQSVSNVAHTCIRESGAFLRHVKNQRAIAGVATIAAGLIAVALLVKHAVLPILTKICLFLVGKTSAAWTFTCEKATSAKTAFQNWRTPSKAQQSAV